MSGDDTRYLTKCLQHVDEHREFMKLLQAEGVRSYLEIGAMFGGSLWKVAHALPRGSRVVAIDPFVDTPDARSSCVACVKALVNEGYDALLIDGRSDDPSNIAAVAELSPFDCLFIDGAHTEEAVTADWWHYGGMARIVAFHDIAWNSSWKSSVPGRVPNPMGVPQVWERIKHGYRHKEIKLHGPKNYYGIGLLWRS